MLTWTLLVRKAKWPNFKMHQFLGAPLQVQNQKSKSNDRVTNMSFLINLM